MIRLGIVVLCAGLASCAAMGERQARRYYVLEPRAAPAAMPRSAVSVAATTAASFYDTQDIAFSRSGGTRGYYQFNHWAERPQRVLGDALAARYASPGERYILATHVVEIYHDAAQAPGVARVTVTAELIERPRRSSVSRRTFTREAPARSHDAAGAVAGFDGATAALLDDIVEWADREIAARDARDADTASRRNRDASFTTPRPGVRSMSVSTQP